LGFFEQPAAMTSTVASSMILFIGAPLKFRA
jgi:hypothetical protein